MRAFLILLSIKKQLKFSSCFYIRFVLFSDSGKRSDVDNLGSLQGAIKFA